MTIHVNIGEAKTRLSELIAAALRGEEVVLNKAGRPVARIVADADASAIEREAIAAKRASAIGSLAEKYAHLPDEAFDIPPSMTDEEYEERIKRKFG
ncbi:type II toxin-antitoxin system Phd/YefM family antitoxin [Alterisphingorhabdus coralli]|uniref:Antitoxin n=1 Tax=Alterisphingorhabdus coralli TaxID=3071408 RepID=A0AA97F4Y9_9SPHN|nr:type II toxin-antitoxin system prevent-host-death family antitoxin [Parasphingorhabdus sp. SCSIO 66989]WOE74414.1 type II toxin-antitoxin system prevent-host-death family antitoxin [Parasphingorhabdus sp. SCSIO 66989]